MHEERERCDKQTTTSKSQGGDFSTQNRQDEDYITTMKRKMHSSGLEKHYSYQDLPQPDGVSMCRLNHCHITGRGSSGGTF